MKRTAEIVLTVIGIILNILMIAGVYILNALFSDEQVREDFEREMQNDPAFADAGLDIAGFYDILSGVGIYFNVVVIISTILSIIAVVVVRGNRKPKLAGGLLLGSAVLVGLGTLLFGWLPSLLFLIAGIMCFARKPKIKEPVAQTHDDELRPL